MSIGDRRHVLGVIWIYFKPTLSSNTLHWSSSSLSSAMLHNASNHNAFKSECMGAGARKSMGRSRVGGVIKEPNQILGRCRPALGRVGGRVDLLSTTLTVQRPIQQLASWIHQSESNLSLHPVGAMLQISFRRLACRWRETFIFGIF